MTELYELQRDDECLFSLLPDDIVQFCIEPYLKYELTTKNIFGFNMEELSSDVFFKKMEMDRPVPQHMVVSRYHELINYITGAIYSFNETNTMNLEQIHKLQSFDDLDRSCLTTLYIYRIIRDIRGFLHLPFQGLYNETLILLHKMSTEIRYFNSSELKRQLELMPTCTICRSVMHETRSCPIFDNRTYIRCDKHGFDHMVVRGRKVRRCEVPHSERSITISEDCYRQCPSCQADAAVDVTTNQDADKHGFIQHILSIFRKWSS